MSSKRKFNRKSKYTLSQKIISAVTAAGFIMQPIAGFAHNIVASNDFGTKVETNGKVTDIWAGKVVGNTAINKFDTFGLNANEIANMYFGQSPSSHGADNLVNFVNSRIDINGTVNAVQNSQIGGNLFFLSKEGMAVGKSGVINTGSLYVMTPTPDFMEAVQTVGTEAPAEDANKYLGYITNITDPTKANAWEIIPVNTSGTITVLGQVNATNEVQMRAAKIGVGKNVDDSAVDNVASGKIAAENAHIETGVANFSDIVNIKDASGKVIVDAGLGKNLTATKTGSGDIVLEAYVDASNDKNEIEKLPVIGGTTLGTTAESVENTFTEQEFAATVDIYGEVNATGKADISATAINSNADFDETLNDYKANNNDVAQLATVKADVNIGGAVKAADDVNIKAEAVNRYVDNTGGFAKALSVGISSGTPLTGDVAYSVLDTEANVNVASGANVASENGSVDIDAKAETLAASAASTTGLKFKAAGGLTGANVPATAVVYTGVDNKANVTVEGDIKAGKDISIDADADMKVEADNKMSLKGKMANQFVVGVTVAGAENSASVDIKGSGNKVSAGNDLSVNAKADSDFTSSTSIKAPEASAITVAVNVTDFNSNANVNVDTDLTAGNNLNVEADNTIVSDNVNAETKLGSNKYISAATQVVTTNAEGKITEVKNFINGLKTKLGFEAGGSDDVKTQLQLSEILKAGATVTYSGQEHKSGVNIGKNGSLTAQNGMLGVNAQTLIEDAHIAATGTTYSYNDAYPAGATLNASVLVNNMDNSSSVVVADRDAASTEPALSGKTGVDVNASVRFEYNRIQNMIQDVEDAYNQIETATANLDGAIKTDFDNFLKDLKTQISNWESAFATADETLATSDSGVLSIGEAATAGYNILNALNNLNTMLDSTSGSEVADATKASIQGASDLLSSALAFIDPNSYGNFAASSASKGSSGNQSTVGGHIPSAINGAGTVIVNNVDTVSKVEIGSNTGIASDRDVNINAESFMKDVTLGGLNAMPITNSGGGTTASIGATVNYSDFNTDTVVAVNNGASITGGNINIAGSNVIDHVSVAGSAGVGPSGETQSSGIVLNGMLSFVNGSSDILTVVDDGASLTANQNEYTETVKDEENGTDKETTKYTEGNISITGHNNSNIFNVAAGLNFGTGSGAVGVGLAYTDFAVKNIAGVADVAGQIKNLYSSKDDDGKVTVDNSKVDELDGELNNTYTASTASSDTKGSISAYGFNVDAATDGSIQSVSAAASANKNDDTGKESFFGKLKGKFSNVENKVFNKLDEKTGQIFGSDSGGADEMFNKGSSTHGTGGGIKLVGSTSGKGGFMPSFSIAGSGSVSLNSLNNATEAIVDNVNITMQPTSNKKGDISVTARDTLYAGAYSGAAALQWKKGGSADNTSVGFSGAAGVNDIDNAVKATIKNSTISNAGKIDTMALSGGEQLALGLGLAVVKADGTSGVSGNAAVSVNLIDHDVEALLENNTVTDANDINVAAYARDIENTGGGTLSAGQQKVGVGATVAVAQLNNNISAGIKGGSYTDVGNVDVDAMNALKNITVGIAAGATVPSGGDGDSAVVEGAGVYNEVHNTTNAFIEGNGSDNKVVITTVDGGIVDVIAQDVAISENSIYEQALDGLADGKKEIAERMGDDFDISGQSELAGIDTSAAETELNKNKEETETKEEVSLDKTGGSSIITVAGGVAATTGKGSGGAAVAITDIENNYTADIDYADITTETLTADAGSSSNIVTVAGGVAVAGKGSGVGSVSWNDVDNTAKVNIKNSVVKAQSTKATAANAAQIVSVGGQISVGGKAGVGAVLSYVGLDNSTEANIVNTTFDKRADDETDGTSVKAEATNTSDSYNIGAGVSAAGAAAVSGTVVVTQTHGTAGAVMDKVTINNAKAVTANALDDTNILSVIGSVAGSGTAAVGGGVAYTEIGDVSTDTEDGQYVTAEIKNNSTINTAGAGSTVNVTAKDTARVINVAVGVGGAGTAAVQGASATTLINKTTSAEIVNTDIDEEKQGSTNANVTVDAQNASEITSSASTVAVAGSGAGVGAGIAVNRIIQQTNAAVNGGTMNVNNLNVNANATPRIENIGVGGGIAGTGAGISGSVAVNMIENDVSAHIGSGANIVADGSVGVVATSDEQIANYAGQLAVGGVGAGVGVSVSVNQIAGTTIATVGGEGEATTSVTAKGNNSLTTDTVIDVDINDSEKSDIHNTLIDDGTVALESSIDRGQETRSGLIVDASSTRDLKSFLITAGVAGTGAGVTGTVNVNQIDGKTTAGIANTTVNSGSANAAGAGNVFVNAGDYSNMSGFVGSAGVGGIGAGVGLGSDTNTISREVTAKVDDSDIKAQGFEVDADSAQGISSFGVGAGVAGIGGGVAGIVTVTELNNTTKAMLNNSKVNANTVNIKANHTGIVNAGNVGVGVGVIGAGAGLSVGVLKDNSATEVSVTGDNAKEDTITASGDVTIAATNTAVVKPVITATGAGAAGVAGATSINNLNSTVKTNIKDVGITSGGSISGTADNNFDVDAYMGSQAGGVGGVGVGVTVNTIDSTVQTNVADSTLDAAEDITLTAQETRTIKQTATNVAAGGVAVGANIAVTNVGQAVENIKDENGETVSNAYDKITEANDVYKNKETGEDNSGDLLAGAEGALETAGIDSDKAIPHVDAGYGGENKDSQITVNITNSNIEADNNVTAKATETDNINMTLGSGAAGAAAVNAGVGVLNVHRNVGVNITGGGISADKIDIGTDITGSANLEVYQGTAGVVGVNAAVGEASTTGSSKVDIDDVIFAGNDIDITAADHGGVKVETLGITVGAVSVGAIVAGAENSGNTEIEITNSEAEAKDADKQSDISITTDKANTVDAHAIGGAGGAVAGQGVVATAKDSGASSITLGAEGDKAKANEFEVNRINVAASAKPFVKAVADSAAVSIFGTAGASVATAEATGNVNVNVYDGNTLSAEDVDITGDAGTQDGKNTAEAKVVGNSGSGYVTVSDNAAVANVETHVNVNVGDVNYKTNTEKVFVGYEDVESSTTGERKEVYKDVVTAATDLNISGSNTSKASTDAKGITIGGIFSSGNNQAFTTNKATTNVSVSGGSEETLLKSLNITASGATDNTAKADGSGGGLVSGDLAAWVKNDSQAEVNASLSGSFNVAGDVTVNALQSDTANINADALKATVVGASATLAENNIGGSTTANITGANITGGGKLDVNAANTITFGNNEQYAVEGSGYGGVNVQGAEFDNIINKKAAVNVTGSKITTNGAQAFEAKTTGNINAGGYIKAAGLGAFTWADIDNTVTSDNSVTVDEDSALKTKKEGADITLAAVDNMDLTVRGQADVQGAAIGGASSDVESVLNRNNKITVGGDLYAMNDVNLYAGKDKNGADGSLDLVAESETYNYAALPIADPKLDDQINQNNQVVINPGSDVSSVRNINLYADAGKETIRDTTLMYTWVYSDKGENYTSSTVGDKEPENKHSNNFVQADGKLVAGVQNKQYITIGKEGELVFLNPDTLEAVNNYGNQVAVGKPTIEASSGVDTGAIVVGTFDYGTTLFERYNELGELMQGYADAPSSTAYIGYKTERERIFDQLNQMGLVQTLTDEKGNKYQAAIEGMTVDYIELPDIVASGGNINIQTDTLSGSGSLKAQGAPEVVINNNTNLYMKINNITVGEPGGEINFNNNSLTSSNYQEKITELNADKTMSVNFNEVSPDAESGTGGRLVINGNYGGGTVYAKVNVDGKEQLIQTTPRADIEINGIVNSQGGTVEITSAANSIIIQGETAEDSAAVKGQTVKLSASKGSVSQGFQEGIVSIGGNVQDQYKDLYQGAKDEFNVNYGFKHDSVKDTWVTSSEGNKPNGNMIAGENIYISASDINVNGKIQSGYADYVVNIDNSVQSKIDQIKNNWQNSGGQTLTDAMVTTGTAYRIVEGKDVLQSDGSYYRQLDVYYNPSTGQIVVPDVDANGGQVYLTGRISSTGSGSIKVLDGAYDINVTNKTGTDLQLGKLVSNNVDGLISIADTGKKQLTEFRRGSTVVKDMTKLDEATGDYKVLSTGGEGNVYNPESGLRYNWTTGQETTTTEEYSNTIKAGLWGAVETMDKTELDKFEQEHKPAEEPEETTTTKPNGEYIGDVDGINNSDNFVVIYENTKLDEDRVGPGEPERWSTGFLGWFKWEKYTWTVKTGTTQQYVASVKADKPISIGFIGNESGNSNINVNSQGNINLTNDIASASGGTGSVIGIASTGGAINQLGGSITGDNIKLSAATGINDVNITSIGDNVNLNAVTTSGDIGINVNAAYGTDGNVVIGNLFAGTAANPAGDVALTASGNITQSGTGTSVSGNRIDLVSTNGAIGTDGQAIIVHGGQQVVDALDSLSASVNAQAKQDINLTQDDGDMRIGRVYSDNGDVTITVNDGDLVDALPAGETVDRGDTDELIQKWTDLGLIEGEGAYTEQIEQDVVDYEAGVKDEFATYKQMKDYYTEHPEGAESDYAYQKFVELYGDYATADDYLAGAEAQAKIAELKNEGREYWDKDQLLYAISDAIINPDSGATDTVVKDPNVKGNNITVNVKGGSAGLNSDNTTVIQLDDLKTDIEALKQLASADASNVIWDEENGTATITEKLPIGIQSTGGGVTVVTDGNVYLSGRTDNDADNVLNINEITAAGDVRLQGQDGIYNVSAGDRAAITGNNLLIQAGSGSIGTADAIMTTQLGGTMQAQAGENIYISQTGDLLLDSVGAGQDVVLAATGNIADSDISLSGDSQGYIRSDNGSITLTAGEAIGADGNGLNILDNGAVVNADAEQGIYLSGVSGEASNGELVLGTIEGASLNVDSVSSVSLGKDAAEDEEAVESSITTTGGDAEITAAKDINLVNGTANVNSGNALNLTATGGSIAQNAASTIYADTVNASAANNINLASQANNVGQFVVNGLGENNSINGSINLAGSRAEGFAADLNGITANGSVNVTNYGQGSLNISGGSVTTTGENAGDVTFTSEGSITADTTVNSAANIVMNADGAITNKGALTAQNNVTVNTTEGAINIGGSVTATDNDVNITTGSGAIITTGNVTGGTNVNVDAGTTGNIELGGIVNAQKGNVDVDTQSGDVTTKGEVTGNTDVTINSGAGNVTVGGNVTATVNNVNVTTGSGAITTTGNVTGGTDVNVQSGEGDVNLKGNIDAESGFVNVTTGSGSITTGGYVSGHKDVTLDSDGGDITVGGYTESETQNVTATVKGDGNINFAGKVSASGDVKAEVEGIGDITTGENATVSGTNIGFTTNEGDITTGSDLTAKENVDLNVNTGDITFGGNVNAGSENAENGNITIDITGGGNLQDAEGMENTLTAIGPEGSETAGNIIIKLSGKGDVDLYDLYATNKAHLDIAEGSLKLHEINGELVAIQLRTEGKDMNVDKITAGTQIVLSGSDMSLDDIAQRPDADGMLVVTPNGAADGKPIDNFTIGNITTNAGSGIRFDHLWVNNSDIHISEGQLWFDKLYVENAAHFSNDDMVAAIYGVPPLRDGSDSVYWNNTAENRPEDNLDMWLKGSGDWMYLRFTDDHIQESNGILLTLDQYDYVYNQRFTAEDHLRYLHGLYPDESWKQTYGYGVSAHERFGLVDYYELPGEENAGEDEIAVEA